MQRDQIQRAKDRVVKRNLFELVEKTLDAAKASGDLADAHAVILMAWYGITAERNGLKPSCR